ncbi:MULTISPECIES: glycosyltransferase family 4 protein [unclassified Methylophaga]|jgi:glycosyltransferase involved in cell wall biosynthesis|uniref:glycosyltransferase family 4 protein n=1 Tax=unclassified Methylophaga TaxID=2629249 RepID=UPI00259CCBFF|nr:MULTISPECIES: glycosyltransferase family 4 protein [unclassified Methylophaga]|tara:strand:- start:2039 stop:3259 length:1221 start_codon:yes stop_codon:yes gene_type:complete
MKILIVCEHASDKFGGEAMLPLNYYKFLSKTNHEVYLVTHERARASLESNLEINNKNIYYLPDTKLHKLIFKLGKCLPARVYTRTFGALLHALTQIYQRKEVKRLVKTIGIDIVHEPAPVSATQPSAMYNVGCPVVIGPLNGGMTFPKSFQDMSGLLEKVIYKLAKYADNTLNRLIPGKVKANLILVANERTKKALPACIKGPVEILVENGSFGIQSNPRHYAKRKLTKVLYVGRLVDWKCIDIAIEAVSKLKNTELTIVGDGQERNNLERLCREKNIENVSFTGLVPHNKINEFYDEADIFVLPSIRECGGAVVLEAMSRGLPVIATDWGGPADYLTPESGFLIAPKSKEWMVEQFSNTILRLADSPELREKIGMNAVERIRKHFLWDDKIQTILSHYKNIKNNK